MNNQNTSYTFGQLGSAYLGTASVNFDPPTGQVIVSILSLDNATEFHTLTPDNDADNTATAFTLSVTPSGADNLNIFISGVYQNSLDSSGSANYTVAGTTLTFATAPPTTAANGIEVVITA